MKFIVDAQLPKSLARFLCTRGFDAIHTLDLPHRNITDELEINRLSFTEKRIVISKDLDFTTAIPPVKSLTNFCI